MSVKVAGYVAIPGTAVMLIRFPAPVVRLLTVTALPELESGMFSVALPEAPMLKLRIGRASEPIVLETTSVPALRLMVLLPPPEVMVLAMTVPAVLSLPMLSVAVTGAILVLAVLVRAKFKTVPQVTTAPVLKRPLLLTLSVPVQPPEFAAAAFP